jgi:hypothetical protein
MANCVGDFASDRHIVRVKIGVEGDEEGARTDDGGRVARFEPELHL